jgi:hypothetical protein
MKKELITKKISFYVSPSQKVLNPVIFTFVYDSTPISMGKENDLL